MIEAAVARFARLSDASLRQAAKSIDIEALKSSVGIELPESHNKFLRTSNGIEVFGGYARILGVGLGSDLEFDLSLWNSENFWKFSWAGRCSDFFCFAETAWGDQYAYKLEEVSSLHSPPVYLLDGMSMSPQKISESFEGFLDEEFTKLAVDPYDVMTVQARGRFGNLGAASHLVYSPSLLLGGEENIENVVVMAARAAMICNGDVAVQIDAGPADREVRSVRVYEDEEQRVRLQLMWS